VEENLEAWTCSDGNALFLEKIDQLGSHFLVQVQGVMQGFTSVLTLRLTMAYPPKPDLGFTGDDHIFGIPVR